MLCLTEREIQELTGYKVGSKQSKWLRENGFRYVVGYDGKPRVSIKHFEEVMGCSAQKERKKTQPNQDALRSYMGIS